MKSVIFKKDYLPCIVGFRNSLPCRHRYIDVFIVLVGVMWLKVVDGIADICGQSELCGPGERRRPREQACHRCDR